MKSILKLVGRCIRFLLGVGRKGRRVSFVNADGIQERGVVLKYVGRRKKVRVRGELSGKVTLSVQAVSFE